MADLFQRRRPARAHAWRLLILFIRGRRADSDLLEEGVFARVAAEEFAEELVRIFLTPASNLRALVMRCISSGGSGSPSGPDERSLSTSGRYTQFSSICEGASTKSVATFVPESVAYCAVVSDECMTCPNSWNSVSTSFSVRCAGLPACGGVKFTTRTVRGT